MIRVLGWLCVVGCGSTPTAVVDATPLPARPPVDIVLALDSVPGTDAYQADLSNGITTLGKALPQAESDYRIGMLTNRDTDSVKFSAFLHDQSGQPFIDRASGDASAALRDATPIGSSRSPAAFREQLYFAVTDEAGVNGGFRRTAAPLHIVVWSPRDDTSTDGVISREAFVSWLGKQHPEVGYHAIVGIPPDCPGAVVGQQHLWVQEQTGGVATSICEPDFGEVWAAVIPEAPATDLSLDLSQRPDPDTMAVFVQTATDRTPFTSWTYDGNLNRVDVTDVPLGEGSLQVEYVPE